MVEKSGWKYDNQKEKALPTVDVENRRAHLWKLYVSKNANKKSGTGR